MVEAVSSILDSFPVTPPPLPLAQEVRLADFNHRYAGRSCYVVGRGPTEFEYEQLAEVVDPVFFINDAVCLEKYVSSETFFFAHDARMRIWLNGSIRATAVLPIDGKILIEPSSQSLGHRGNVVYYHWREMNQRAVLQTTRDQLAGSKLLFLHSGTIHPLIHFLWFCGFTRVNFIGCDGINSKALLEAHCHSQDGYDARLENQSLTCPGWHYADIRRRQDLLMTFFGMEAVYLGSPRIGEFGPSPLPFKGDRP